MGSKVSIVLVNYNGLKFNKACLDSLLSQTYKNFEIVFVDNDSKDWSLEEVKEKYQNEIKEKKIIIVENEKNTWFALWTNIWVEHADKKSEYISLLNNDTTLPQNRLEELVKWIESDPKLWALSGLILELWHEEETIQAHIKKKETLIYNLFGDVALKKVPDEEVQKWIYYTSAASCTAVLYKKSIIKEPFPGFYFAYAEDTFFFLYMIKKWYKTAICTKALCYHFGWWSFGKKPSNLKLFYGNRNQIINFLIFYKTTTILKLLPLFLVTQTGHLLISVFWKRLRAKTKARWRILMHIRTISALKKQVQANTNISEKEFIQHLSYNFSDNLFWGNFSEAKIKMIKKANIFFKFYCKHVL